MIVDVWEQSYGEFHHFAKSPSRYGSFEPPHLRHMMAERAVMDTLWYAACAPTLISTLTGTLTG